MKLLVVGNGSTGVDNDGKHYINNHTGDFLVNLNKFGFIITFCELEDTYEKNANLQNFQLEQNNISFLGINTKTSVNKITGIVKALFKLIFFKNIYIFQPGSLGKIIGYCSIMLNKKTGIYIRGQNFGVTKTEKNILRKAHFILTVSPTLRRWLNEYCTDVDIIRPMISIKENDIYKRPILRNRPTSWKLLFVGRVEERKGILELLQVAKSLNNYGLDFELRIVGGGELYKRLIEQQKVKQLPDNIVFTGQIIDKNQLMQEYKNAHAFIFPSHDEGFPRTLYEAMANSMPIFTTMVGGISGIMKNEFNCIEIPVQNPNNQAKVIFKYLHQLNTLNYIGSNGLKTLSGILNSKQPHDKLVLLKMKANE